MTVRVKVTPDADGIVRISCGGSDLELDVQPATSGASAGGAGHNPVGDTILSLRGRSWRMGALEATALGSPANKIAIDADTIDMHGLTTLSERYAEAHPKAPAPRFHVNLNSDAAARQ